MSEPTNTPAGAPGTARFQHHRRTPLAARGEPMVWLTGASLSLCLLLIATLLVAVVVNGSRTFWQAPLHLVELESGERFLGLPVRDEAYDAAPADRATLDAIRAERPDAASLFDEDGRPLRRLYRVGNRELTGQPFRWTPLYAIESMAEPDDGAMLERQQWGIWLGVPEAIVRVDQRPPAAGEQLPFEGEVRTEGGVRRILRREAVGPDDEPVVEEWTWITSGPAETWAALHEHLDPAQERFHEIERLKEDEIGAVDYELEKSRLNLREQELRLDEGRISQARYAEAVLRHEARVAALEIERQEIMGRLRAIEREDMRWRLIIREPTTGQFAPLRQTRLGDPMLLSQIVRVVRPNTLTLGEKWAVYFARWGEFLGSRPREANTEGGVFPVIFSTVMLTILLSGAVAPLGVIAALYLREYAKQGVIVSAVRVAVNNLAGVPSIVYGVFGLGFFCYTIGRYIDEGPEHSWGPGLWLAGLAALVVIILAAFGAMALAKPVPGIPPTRRNRAFGWASGLLWVTVALLLVALAARTPFFDGFFRAKLPTPTFGTKGILWSALTLALLTLPVVIVATEEAISAVPRSLREGSYGCGASKWQTIQRIVLPRAAPGIMTGMILAMARGAGEVAPLMLVGAVKLADELPFSGRFPFIHLERAFMHLGFHIYDVGFQSPDSEASRPVAWTTTLLLILVVAALNLAAIAIRARLRRRFQTGAF